MFMRIPVESWQCVSYAAKHCNDQLEDEKSILSGNINDAQGDYRVNRCEYRCGYLVTQSGDAPKASPAYTTADE